MKSSLEARARPHRIVLTVTPGGTQKGGVAQQSFGQRVAAS